MKGGTYEVFSFIGFTYRIKTDEQRFTGRTDGYFAAGDRFSQRRTAGCRLIAGDIYDKAVPAAEAVEVFDSFITELKGLCRRLR